MLHLERNNDMIIGIYILDHQFTLSTCHVHIQFILKLLSPNRYTKKHEVSPLLCLNKNSNGFLWQNGLISAPGCNIINHWNLYHFGWTIGKIIRLLQNSLAACLWLRMKDFPKPVGNNPSFPARRYGTHLGWDCYWSTSQKHFLISPQISQTGANLPLVLSSVRGAKF